MRQLQDRYIDRSGPVAEARRRAALIIEADGAFRISTSIGAFVCR
jgi:hypothetical protein